MSFLEVPFGGSLFAFCFSDGVVGEIVRPDKERVVNAIVFDSHRLSNRNLKARSQIVKSQMHFELYFF